MPSQQKIIIGIDFGTTYSGVAWVCYRACPLFVFSRRKLLTTTCIISTGR